MTREANESQDCRYALRTVIYHQGKSYDSGEYVAVSRPTTKSSWYLCNKDSIERVDAHYLLNGSRGLAYMALHEKTRADAATTGTPRGEKREDDANVSEEISSRQGRDPKDEQDKQRDAVAQSVPQNDSESDAHSEW